MGTRDGEGGQVCGGGEEGHPSWEVGVVGVEGVGGGIAMIWGCGCEDLLGGEDQGGEAEGRDGELHDEVG